MTRPPPRRDSVLHVRATQRRYDPPVAPYRLREREWTLQRRATYATLWLAVTLAVWAALIWCVG